MKHDAPHEPTLAQPLARIHRPGGLLALVALLCVTAWGCGPAPGYPEEPEGPQPESRGPALQPEDVNTACRQAPAQQRMQGRMSRYSSIEGMGTLACPPTPLGTTGR